MNVTYSEIIFYSISIVMATMFCFNLIYIVKSKGSTGHNKITFTINILWLLIVLFLVLVISSMFDWIDLKQFDKHNNLIASIGISLSALLASATVMKSIINSNEIEFKKEKRELQEKRLEVYYSIIHIQHEIMGHKLNKDYIEKFKIETRISEFIFKDKNINEELSSICDELYSFNGLIYDLNEKKTEKKELEEKDSNCERFKTLTTQISEMAREEVEKYRLILTRLNFCRELIKPHINLF